MSLIVDSIDPNIMIKVSLKHYITLTALAIHGLNILPENDPEIEKLMLGAATDAASRIANLDENGNDINEQ